jgi:hypothetical protein
MERNHGFIKVAPDKKEIQDLTEKAVKNYVSEDSQREGFSISTEESFGDLENQAIAKYLNLRDGETVEEIIQEEVSQTNEPSELDTEPELLDDRAPEEVKEAEEDVDLYNINKFSL